jgi:hypothetical protein
MVEAGNSDEAIPLLTATIAAGEEMVADLLPIRRGDVDQGALSAGSAG